MSMTGGNPKAPKKPTCHKCGASLGSGAKAVIEGLWTCAKCTYEHDYPDAKPASTRHRRALPLQEETLFPVPPKKPSGAP